MIADTKHKPNPDHDRQAAGLYQAIALRFYCRYVDARHQAKFCGEDVQGAEPLLTQAEASRRYRCAVDEWLGEDPSTPDAILAFVEFAAVIAADKFVGEAVRDSGPVSDETDALHQNRALSAVGEWFNQHVLMRDWLDRRVAAYGPSGMPGKSAEEVAANDPFALARQTEGDAELFALIAEYQRQERELNTPKGRADEEIHRLSDDLRAARCRVNKVRPVTLRGVLAVLNLGSVSGDMHWWPAEAIEGLREIVETEARS